MRPRDWQARAVDAAEAVAPIADGHRVFVHGAAATPTPLLEAMAGRTDLERVRLYHLHLEGPAPFAAPEHVGRFLSVSLFVGASLREVIAAGRADFVPVFLSDIPSLFLTRQIPLDVALLQLSPPDAHGYCSLGTSIDTAKAAADTARIIIAEINERMPRTHGNVVVPFDRITAFIHTDRPLHERPPEPETPTIGAIGEVVARLIEDRSTLQVGIGSIPDAVLLRLRDKRDLGISTETFSDRVVDLVEAGAVTNRYKYNGNDRIITSFVAGTKRLYDFVHDNPRVEFHPCDRTNDPALIAQNERVVAINSALEVDLSGQVSADSLGHKIYSGVGGQVDFIRGAARSRGGKPVIALQSTARGGSCSRIVGTLSPGAGVVTTRAHVHWVATEHGAVNLHGLSLRERGEALISIAHPDFRGELRRELAAIRHFPLGE